MKNILISLFCFTTFITSANASRDEELAKWRNQVSKDIRKDHSDALKQTTYRNIDIRDVKVSDDLKNVYPRIESKVSKAGTSSRVVAEAVLDTSKEKVARDWAGKIKKYGRGGVATVTIGLLVDELLKSLDYVMGEGGQITRPSTNTASRDPSQQYYYMATSDYSIYGVANKQEFSYASLVSKCSAVPQGNIKHKGTPTITRDAGNGRYGCLVTFYMSPTNEFPGYTFVTERIANPSYKKDTPEPKEAVPDDVIKDAIKSKVLDEPSKKSLAKDLIKNSYGRIWDDQGNYSEIGPDVTNKHDEVLTSDDPQTDGHTTNTPTATDGKTGSGTSTSNGTSTGTTEKDATNTNPDEQQSSSSATSTTTTTTTTTNTEFNFELPAFCDWAGTVCDWYESFKEFIKPDDEKDNELEIDDELVLDVDTNISFSGSCPADKTIPFDFGIGVVQLKFSYSLLCQPLADAKPILILVGLFLSALIVAGIKT